MKKILLCLLVCLAFLPRQCLAIEVKKGLKKSTRIEHVEILQKITESSARIGSLLQKYNPASQKVFESSTKLSKSNDDESTKILETRDLLENIFNQTAIFKDILSVSEWIEQDKTCPYLAFVLKRQANYLKLYAAYIDLANQNMMDIHDAKALENIRNARDVLKDCKASLDSLQNILISHDSRFCHGEAAQPGAAP